MIDTTLMYTTAAKGRAAVRRLRKFGVLSYWDAENRALVAYVTKFGIEPTRASMRRAIDPLAEAEKRMVEYFNVVARS